MCQRIHIPENTYTIENEFEDINQDNAYLYVSDGKYYLHCEQGNVVIDKQSMKLFKKAGLKFKGGN